MLRADLLASFSSFIFRNPVNERGALPPFYLSGSVASLLVLDLVTPTALIQVTQHSLPSALCLSSSSKQRHFSSTLLNQSYLKATSTNWSFGKEYYCSAADIIRHSQLALMYVAYAQGLVYSALDCNTCDSQMENHLYLILVASPKCFHIQMKELIKKESGARENTLVWFLFNYTPTFLAYSTMLKMNTTDAGRVLNAHGILTFY